MLKTSDFDFVLPEGMIATEPAEPRDSARLMVVDTERGMVEHKIFSDLSDYLGGHDVLVLNRSKVIPARIRFEFEGRGREIFLLEKVNAGEYLALVRPGKFFGVGKVVDVNEGLKCEILEVLEDGSRRLRFFGCNDIESALNEAGETPLPPYIKGSKAQDVDYQTVYAHEAGSVAAPTAGLHFTESLLKKLNSDGVQIEEAILHVGRGTFEPVKTEKVEDHLMHSEKYELSENVADRLNVAVGTGKRVVATGTTSVRILESSFDYHSQKFYAGNSATDIFIYPGAYKWKVVNGLITNFHLPKSTLLMLVASFLESKGVEGPLEKLHDLYSLAIEQNYRFYSFGDAMLII